MLRLFADEVAILVGNLAPILVGFDSFWKATVTQ